MRIEQMKQEEIWGNPNLPDEDYFEEIYNVDFGECTQEYFLHKFLRK